MKIAIVHYHLNRGGVTQVIVNHLRSLAAARQTGTRLEVSILFGGRCAGWPEEIGSELDGIDLKLVPVAGLDYDSGTDPQPADLAAAISSALRDAGAGADETVLHVHNHSLGKNVSLPGALSRLAEQGFRLLLHVHDFAEDFRPDVYRRLEGALAGPDQPPLGAQLYPQAQQIHYAALNRRDWDVLVAAGVPHERLHLLPNPVFDVGPLPERPPARAKLQERFGVPLDGHLLLYPVRGIRRKNVGEALLWSVLAGGTGYVGMTLEPLNPLEQGSYRHWRSLAEQLQLPAVFGLGESGGLSFTENLACADSILTTSVAEGFGMVFAEAWLAGRPLVGRDLPDITRDFVQAGLDLGTLQERLDVPLELIGRDEAEQAVTRAYHDVLQAYGRLIPPTEVLKQGLSEVFREEKVDFAALPRKLQTQVVQAAHRQPDVGRAIERLNPWLPEVLTLTPAVAEPLIRRNADVVREGYSLAACGNRLTNLYSAVTDSGLSSVEPLPRSDSILDSFLEFGRLRPVRTEA